LFGNSDLTKELRDRIKEFRYRIMEFWDRIKEFRDRTMELCDGSKDFRYRTMGYNVTIYILPIFRDALMRFIPSKIVDT
jgi:hypothetical protein